MKKDKYLAGIQAVFVAGWVDAQMRKDRDATKYPGEFRGAYACGFDLYGVKDIVEPFVLQTASNGFDDGYTGAAKRAPVMPAQVAPNSAMMQDFLIVYSDAYTVGMLEKSVPAPTPVDPTPVTPVPVTPTPPTPTPTPVTPTTPATIEGPTSNTATAVLGGLGVAAALVGIGYVILQQRQKKAYANPTKDIKPGYVWLQFVGWVKGKPVRELRPGDRMMWNYGSTSLVKKVEQVSPQYVVVTEILEDGNTFDRKMKLDRLVAIAKGT